MSIKKVDDLNRNLMELSISNMEKSIHEARNDGKISPKVGAVLRRPDGTLDFAYRGELREGDHAEYTLLERKNRDKLLEGCELFTTLEPCMKRNSPKLCCAERIVNARIKKVWIGIEDPDPTVDRKGIQFLQDNGIEVQMFDRDLQLKIQEQNKHYINQAKDRALKVEHKEKTSLSEIEESVPDAKYSELDMNYLDLFRKKAKIGEMLNSRAFEDILVRLGLCHIEDDKLVPSGYGVLLFGINPRQTYQNAGLVAKITYPNGQVENEIFDGPIVSIPKKLEEWYINKLPYIIDRTHAERKKYNPIPFEIVREAVVNALIHRDYSIDGAKCQLEISYDKVVIKSPGSPVKPISLEQLQDFSAPQLSRNPLLHYVFNILDLAEETNFGMETWKSLPNKYKLPLPKYAYDSPYLSLIIFSNYNTAIQDISSDLLQKLSGKEKNGLEIILKLNSFNRLDYQINLGVETRAAQRHLKHFIEMGIIDKTGEGPSTVYKVVR